MKNTPRLFSIALLAATVSFAHANETIETDRPDFVESSSTVGAGRVQIETSVQRERDDSDGVTNVLISTPTLLRIGFAQDWEARIESDGRSCLRTETDGTEIRECGWAAAALGVKWHMVDPEQSLFGASIGWLFHVDTPSGSAAFRGTEYQPSVRAVMEWELPANYSLGIMPGLARNVDDNGQRFTSKIFGIVLGKELTSSTRAFVEYAGQSLTGISHGGSVATFDAGLAWLLNDNMQLDFVVNRGLTQQTPDLAVAAGFSVRF